MIEAKIEQRLVREIKKLGGIAYKFTSPSRRHVPDRLCLLPFGLMVFVECKATGGKLRPAQLNEVKRIQKLGHFVTVVDSYESIDALIKETKEILYDREQRSSIRQSKGD